MVTAPNRVALTVVASDPNVDEQPHASDSKALTTQPSGAQLSVEYWWEEVTGASNSLSMEYLLDLSTPWTEQAFKHVFAPHDAPLATRQTTELTPKDRGEIILGISKTFKSICQTSTLKQPCVSFVGHEVHLASLDETLLEAFWRSPPIFKGHPLRFVSRGLPLEDIVTSYAINIPAMARDELIRRIASPQNSDRKLVLASLYQVKGLPGSPMFGGDVYVYENAAGQKNTQLLWERY